MLRPPDLLPNSLKKQLNSPVAGPLPETGGKLWQRLFSSRNRVFAIPKGIRVYAIGDIHGCDAELRALLDLIEADARKTQAECRLIFLGDYIDRGPASKDVVDRLFHIARQFRTICLRGNHEQMLLDFLDDAKVLRTWSQMGGRETLLSYGVAAPSFDDERAFCETRDAFVRALPKNHLKFFQHLQFSTRLGDYFFVHAGIRPGVALEAQREQDMMWIRNIFLRSSNDFGAMIVHGHTPSEGPVCQANRMGLDTGAYATGRLTTAVLEGTSVRFMHT
jgi:serine/threonine protein phosphatase 1